MKQMIPAWIDDKLVPVEKLDAHIRGLKHRAVSVFVMHGDEMLIQRRALGKYHTPGLWANTCCTHPLWDESPEDCAKRRLAQELGIKGVSPVWKANIEYRADVGGGMVEHEVVDMFLVTASRRPSIALDPEEVSEVRWTTLADLRRAVGETPDAFTPWLQIYLREHMASVLGPA
ncbi:MAG: isopentenyl-diphosphate Delta-isomerase [Maritimibacter sp.]